MRGGGEAHPGVTYALNMQVISVTCNVRNMVSDVAGGDFICFAFERSSRRVPALALLSAGHSELASGAATTQLRFEST